MKHKIFYMLCVNTICTKSPVEIKEIKFDLNASSDNKLFSRGPSRVKKIINQTQFINERESYKYGDNIKVNPDLEVLTINMDKNMQYKTIIEKFFSQYGIKNVRTLKLTFPRNFDEKSIAKEITTFKKIMKSLKIEEIDCEAKYQSYFEDIVTNKRELRASASIGSEDPLLIEENSEEDIAPNNENRSVIDKSSKEITVQVFETFEILNNTTWFRKFINLFRSHKESAPKLEISERKINNSDNTLVIKFDGSAANLNMVDYMKFTEKYKQEMETGKYSNVKIYNLPDSNDKFRNILLFNNYQENVTFTLETPQNRKYMEDYIQNAHLNNVKISN